MGSFAGSGAFFILRVARVSGFEGEEDVEGEVCNGGS